METSNKIPCVCGLRPLSKQTIGDVLIVWIESPRTGKRLSISGGWVKSLPARVLSRIAQARGMGRNVVEFSRDELRAIHELYQRYNAATTSTGLYIPWMRGPKPFNRRRR